MLWDRRRQRPLTLDCVLAVLGLVLLLRLPHSLLLMSTRGSDLLLLLHLLKSLLHLLLSQMLHLKLHVLLDLLRLQLLLFRLLWKRPSSSPRVAEGRKTM